MEEQHKLENTLMLVKVTERPSCSRDTTTHLFTSLGTNGVAGLPFHGAAVHSKGGLLSIPQAAPKRPYLEGLTYLPTEKP